MFFSKCKKCGGKKVSIITNIDIEIHGTMRKATNVPAKQCEKCGDIVVNDIILERLKKYAHDYPNHYVEQQYLPDALAEQRFYEPTEMGYEKIMTEHMEKIRNQ